MASLQIEVASSSSPFSHSLRDHNRSANIKGYIQSQSIRQNKAGDAREDSSWLPSPDSKTDDSWLPAHDTRHHRKAKNHVVDHSWLPTTNDVDVKRKSDPKTSEPKKEIDYSWLPETNQKKHNKNKTKTKPQINTNSNDNNGNSNSNSEMQKKSKNNHWALAREVVFSCDNHIQASDSSKKQQQDSPSSSNSRNNMESPNSGGVSSLLRKWKDLAESKNCNNTCNNLDGSPSGLKVSTSASQSPQSADESDKNSYHRRFSCPFPNNDTKDKKDAKEKTRVGNIIKKLSQDEDLSASQARNGNENGNESLPRIRTSLDNQQIEVHKGYKGVKVSRNPVRGQQAFENFLMLTDHHKHRELKWLLERKAVSKFSHRSRLKALLRFKFLRVEAEPKPKLEVGRRHRRCVSKTLELNNRLAIMDLRERFDSGSEKSGKHRRSIKKNTPNEEVFATPTAGREVDVKTKIKTQSTTSFNKKQEPYLKLDPMTPNHESTYSSKYVVQRAKDVLDSSNSIMPKARYKEDEKYLDFQEEEGQFMSAKTSYGHVEDRGLSDVEEPNYNGKKQVESFEDWMTSEYSQRSDLDEEETYEMQIVDNNYDWISDVSRPKSFWDDLRQARYQEMLDQCSGNVDIPRLLERKTVSSFLSSGLRELIDNLMMSRIQQSDVHVEKQVVVSEKGVARKEEVEQGYGTMVDEDGVFRGRTGRQYIEYNEYLDQTPYSERSWRPNDGIYSPETTTTTTTTTTATTSPSLDRSTPSTHVNSTPQSSPPVTHSSIELDLIYDLRGHMELLHQEIMELRRSIKSCVYMQVKMQHSIYQNVATSRSVRKKEGKLPRVGKTCSICGDMQVDTFLYRCGHMCTCFKCAVGLQRTSGECPVCEAPIVDVVKAFAHEN